MIYVNNDKQGLEFIRKVLRVFPDFKYRNVVNFLRQTNEEQFIEI